MKFYFGVSKRIPIKWILIAIGGILAFLGFTLKANALELSDLQFKAAYNTGDNHNQTFYCNQNYGSPRIYFSTNFVNNSDVVVVYYSSVLINGNNTSGSLNDLEVGKMLFATDNSVSFCEDKGSYLICPVVKGKTYNSIYLEFLNNNFACNNNWSSKQYLFAQYFYGYDYKVNASSQAIIDNNNQNAQDIIDSQQQIQDSINNSSVDSSSTSGGGFFDNFSVDDSRGFSSIIVAPLQFLRDLLTSGSTCSPLGFDIEMKDDNIRVSNTNLSLPCGDVLWSRVPQAIELIWVTLVWGLVGYRLLIDMVKFINNSLNPEYSKEYFLDL